MSTYTENYNLIKPDEDDCYDVAEFNENMDTLDAAMTEIENGIHAVNEKMGNPATEGETLFSLLSSGGSLIKSIQRVKYHVTVANSTSSTVAIKPVNPDRCVVLLERLGSDSYNDYSLTADTLHIFHNSYSAIYNGSEIDSLVGFWIIEFN